MSVRPALHFAGRSRASKQRRTGTPLEVVAGGSYRPEDASCAGLEGFVSI